MFSVKIRLKNSELDIVGHSFKGADSQALAVRSQPQKDDELKLDVAVGVNKFACQVFNRLKNTSSI